MEITPELLAPKSKRFGNFVIDMIVRYLLFMIIGVIAALIDPEGFLKWSESISRLEEILYSLLVLFLYFLWMETITQRTVGKYITGTKVVMADGSRPGIGVIFKRTLCRMIPFEVLSFIGETSLGWHDSLSKTRVVDIKLYNEALQLHNSFEEIGKTEEI